MNENLELVEFIYEDADMSVFTLEELLKDLKDRDNKMKEDIEHILKGYERYLKDSKKILKKHDVKGKKTSMMSRMGASHGIKKEVKEDNSDASIADMLIKGISMGSLDMEKKIKSYKESADQEILKFANNFKEFQQDNITALKKFL